MKLLAFLLLTLMAFADTIINDPVFKPPQFTTATRPTCPTAYGCFGYNTDVKNFELFDGTAWREFGTGLLQEWQTGVAYKVGQVVNAGVDKNWLLKVAVDHTSTDVDVDLNNGNLLALSPPIITTGVQQGGQLVLAGNSASVQSGAGFIATYADSISPFPIIKSIEWGPQNVTLPATGVHSLFIDPTGTLISVAGYADSAFASQNISVGVVDMNLGKSFDRETYPTNPVGQLMSLSFFLGGMTKGLSYTATGLTLAKSAYDLYYWGANTADHYDPNTRHMVAVNPAAFFEFTQIGATDNTARTTYKTDVYDNAGVLATISNNKWGFTRIYSSLIAEDYVMYAQKEYATKADAEAGVLKDPFIKPPSLELTKFSGWFVYEKGDTDLSDNTITVCEPFGCDKIGTGSGGGSGNVTGPALSVTDNITTFADSSGKVIKDSGIPISAIGGGGGGSGDVVGPATSVANNLPSFADATGKLIKDSGIPAGAVQVSDPVEELQANTLSYTPASSGKLDWSNVTKNTISTCGTVTITDATNRFTYTGKKSCLVNVTCGVLADINEQSGVSININGAARSRSFMGQVSATSGMIPATLSAVINAGDVLICTSENFAGAPPTSGAASNIILTATPQPEVAKIMKNPNTQAGWLGERAWPTTCTWISTSTTMAPFPANATCGTEEINRGLVIPDAVTDGQLPKLTLSKLPKGKILVTATGNFGSVNQVTGDAYNNFQLYLNGTWVSNNNSMRQSLTGAGVTQAQQLNSLMFSFDNPTELTNAVLELQTNSSAAGNQTQVSRPIISVYYHPDLSIPENQSYIAVLPPQVINSSGKKWRTESCYITNNGTAAMASTSCGTFVQSVNRTAAGAVAINFLPSIWSVTPNCTISSQLLAGNCTAISTTTTLLTTAQTMTNAGIAQDQNFTINCEGLQ